MDGVPILIKPLKHMICRGRKPRQYPTQRSGGISLKSAKVETIRGVEGKWVLVVDGRVVVSSGDIKEVLEEARKYPSEKSVVTRILHGGASFY